MTDPVSERDALVEQAQALIPQHVWDRIHEAGLSVEDVAGPMVDGGWRPQR